MTTIRARSWQRYSLQRLTIDPTLKGASHTFEHAGHKVEVKLPSQESKSPHLDFAAGLYCSHWRRDVPVEYHVLSADVFVEVDRLLDIPEQALKIPPRHEEFFEPKQVKELDKISNLHRQIATQSIHLWIDVLRWKAKAPRIGEPTIVGGARGWGPRLENVADGHKFWVENQVLSPEPDDVVTAAHWACAGQVLASAERPPVWIGFIFDAVQRHCNSDQRGAALSAAIGLEVLMRSILARRLPTGGNDPLVIELLDLSNLRSIINRRKKIGSWSSAWESHFNESLFNQLLNCRDAIMHRADLTALSTMKWDETLKALQEFAHFAEGRFTKDRSVSDAARPAASENETSPH